MSVTRPLTPGWALDHLSKQARKPARFCFTTSAMACRRSLPPVPVVVAAGVVFGGVLTGTTSLSGTLMSGTALTTTALLSSSSMRRSTSGRCFASGASFKNVR